MITQQQTMNSWIHFLVTLLNLYNFKQLEYSQQSFNADLKNENSNVVSPFIINKYKLEIYLNYFLVNMVISLDDIFISKKNLVFSKLFTILH